VTELPGTQVFCNDRIMLYILAGRDGLPGDQKPTLNRRAREMFGVVVGDGGPFEGFAKVPLDPLHKITRQPG